jgi:serine/threonine protein kinase
MKARHPFIVGFAFSFQTDAKVYLGLEYVAGGELFHHLQKVRRVPVADVRIYIAELSLALIFLHVQGVIYRDLKPENLLIDTQGHIKMTDFGLAKQLDADDETTSTFCGTSEYLAPELVARRPYGFKIDWWALGILTYELLFGQTPFYRENKARMFEAIRTEPLRFPPRADPAVVGFVSALLDKDADARADFARIRGHAFFAGLDFEKVLARQVQPSYVPNVSGVGIKNFDSEFTAERAMDSFATPTRQAHDEFAGFSCVGGSPAAAGASSSDGEDAGGLVPTRM